MATGEDRVTPGLNEEEVIELFIENLSNILGGLLKKKLFYECTLDMK